MSLLIRTFPFCELQSQNVQFNDLAINFLNSVLALEYHTNPEGFFLEAQRQTTEHAGSSAAYLELTKVLVVRTFSYFLSCLYK